MPLAWVGLRAGGPLVQVLSSTLSRAGKGRGGQWGAHLAWGWGWYGAGKKAQGEVGETEGEGFAVSPGGGTHLTSQAGDGGRVGWEEAVCRGTRLVAGREALRTLFQEAWEEAGPG